MTATRKPVLVSIQVGMPREHGVAGAEHPHDRLWTSAIFKSPVEGAVWLGRLNLVGDGQVDLESHGGRDKAVLGYAADHYPRWRDELGMPDLPYGAFGENFTMSGLDEEEICIGDTWAVGEAQVQISQPRLPCWKLARRWRLRDLPARVLRATRGGWYFRVLEEGHVERAQTMHLVERPFPDLSVARVFRAWRDGADGPTRRALGDCPLLSPGWRSSFLEKA
jgi:MOSC domain-containing protein YiiM